MDCIFPGAPHSRAHWRIFVPEKRFAFARNFLLILHASAVKIESRTIHAEDASMSDEYGSDFISITDEDGKEYELEVLAELE